VRACVRCGFLGHRQSPANDDSTQARFLNPRPCLHTDIASSTDVRRGEVGFHDGS
jgi:hypothetical protein